MKRPAKYQIDTSRELNSPTQVEVEQDGSNEIRGKRKMNIRTFLLADNAQVPIFERPGGDSSCKSAVRKGPKESRRPHRRVFEGQAGGGGGGGRRAFGGGKGHLSSSGAKGKEN